MMDKTIRLDVTEKDIKGLSLGDDVTLTVKGEIILLRAKEEYDSSMPGDKKSKPKVFPPAIEIKMASMKLSGENEFSALADEGDDE